MVGSQAIVGSYRETELPAAPTMSGEVDILLIGGDNAEIGRLADMIDGVAGEFSPFEELHGYRVRRAIGIETAWSAMTVRNSGYRSAGIGFMPWSCMRSVALPDRRG